MSKVVVNKEKIYKALYRIVATCVDENHFGGIDGDTEVLWIEQKNDVRLLLKNDNKCWEIARVSRFGDETGFIIGDEEFFYQVKYKINREMLLRPIVIDALTDSFIEKKMIYQLFLENSDLLWLFAVWVDNDVAAMGEELRRNWQQIQIKNTLS